MEREGGSLGGVLSGPLQELTHYWLLALVAGRDHPTPLSRQEQAWADQLPTPVQARYRLSRSLMRQCVAPLLGLTAAEVPLRSPPGQAPRLAPGSGHVSLSHSAGQLLIAWSPQPIGVDLEWAQRPVAAAALARRFYPPEETSRLLALSDPARSRALLESWVRKEAAIKWQGSSLSADLRYWFWDGDHQQLRHLRQGWQPPSLCEEREGWLCGAVGAAAAGGIWG